MEFYPGNLGSTPTWVKHLKDLKEHQSVPLVCNKDSQGFF